MSCTLRLAGGGRVCVWPSPLAMTTIWSQPDPAYRPLPPHPPCQRLRNEGDGSRRREEWPGRECCCNGAIMPHRTILLLGPPSAEALRLSTEPLLDHVLPAFDPAPSD